MSVRFLDKFPSAIVDSCPIGSADDETWFGPRAGRLGRDDVDTVRVGPGPSRPTTSGLDAAARLPVTPARPPAH